MPETSHSVTEALRHLCADGPVSYRDYIEFALYDPACGYYTTKRQRVGRAAKTDFYTAESLGVVFARLVATAAEDLLGPDLAAASQFIEIAAEPEASLLGQIEEHPFADSQVIRQSEPITAVGRVVIFANEWLDALPFHRIVYRDGRWRERGVRLDASGKPIETLLDEWTAPVAGIAGRLPADSREGYEIDLPLDAETALSGLLDQDWTGLLLLFDYGKRWQQLVESCPAGTARSYYRHTQGVDLLARPGEQDITCDICWDPLEERLRTLGFDPVRQETQESFFVRHAGRAAEAIVRESAGQFSTVRQTLMELLHPAHMGRRFQVLWGRR
ncbi:MAG: SAM-dependent methyltransferase [Opitutales bacterium]